MAAARKPRPLCWSPTSRFWARATRKRERLQEAELPPVASLARGSPPDSARRAHHRRPRTLRCDHRAARQRRAAVPAAGRGGPGCVRGRNPKASLEGSTSRLVHSLARVVDLGIPVLDVLLVRVRGREKGDVLGAAQPPTPNRAHAFPLRFGNAVVSVDDVVSSGGDFGE